MPNSTTTGTRVFRGHTGRLICRRNGVWEIKLGFRFFCPVEVNTVKCRPLLRK